MVRKSRAEWVANHQDVASMSFYTLGGWDTLIKMVLARFFAVAAEVRRAQPFYRRKPASELAVRSQWFKWFDVFCGEPVPASGPCL